MNADDSRTPDDEHAALPEIGTGGTEPFPPSDEPVAEVPIEAQPCWRCGRLSDPNRRCPHCRARPRHLSSSDLDASSPRDAVLPLQRVLIGYAVMMVPAILWGWALLSGVPKTPSDLMSGAIALEVFDTVLTLVMMVWIGRLPMERPALYVRVGAWLTAPVALAGALVVNVAYHHFLRQALKLDWVELPRTEWSLLVIVVYAVQPAIVEELFFRYLALGALVRILSVHWAVFISVVLFALAHVYQPLGLPWLIVLGLVLGYARVASGGLLLPMLLHFAHNLIVLWLEVTR